MPEDHNTEPATPADRPLGQSIRRGMMGKCPACGEPDLFKNFLSTNDLCPHCGEEIFHHRADDGPPFFSMFFVTPIVVISLIIYDNAMAPPMWHHLVLGMFLSLGLCVGLIRPIKGFFIGVQWAKRMHGFGSSNAADQ